MISNLNFGCIYSVSVSVEGSISAKVEFKTPLCEFANQIKAEECINWDDIQNSKHQMNSTFSYETTQGYKIMYVLGR